MARQTLKALCFHFLKDRRMIDKSSLLTIKSYDSDLRQLLCPESPLWIHTLAAKKGAARPPCALRSSSYSLKQKKGLEAEIKSAVENAAKGWAKLSPSSQNRKLAAVKAFIAWLFKEGYIESDFRKLYRSPQGGEGRPNFLSVDEILFLMRSIEKSQDKSAARDLALFSLLYGAALRLSEAAGLKKQDIDLKGKTALVLGKGGKGRLVPIPSQAVQRLKAFKAEGEYFFGKKPLNPRTGHRIVQKWGLRAGLLKPLHPHALRHSCATHLLAAGADLRSIQELLGHKTLAATQKYTHLDLSALAQTLERRHPLRQKAPFAAKTGPA